MPDTNFNIDPYYDDFDEDKKFLRMMFRPGYAVQARELTQLQSMLQNQIERFGDHVFEDGSIILDGQVNEHYLRYARFSGLNSSQTPEDLIGMDLIAADGTRAKVVHAESGLNSTVDPNPVIFFEYSNGIGVFNTGTILSGTANDGVSVALTVAESSASVPSVGNAVLVSVDRGIRYVEGFFVMNDAQKIGAYTLTGTTGSEYRIYDNPTTRIGFDVEKTFVSADDDDSLNDPAFGFYNYAAPGSDRFKVDLTLNQYTFVPTNTSSTDNFSRQGFVEFIRILSGKTVKKEVYPEYAVLEDTLARRTYDESGNYTVVPFELTVSDNENPEKINLDLDPGKAYVFGYEFETQYPTTLVADKARSKKTQNSIPMVSGFGQYLLTSLTGGTTGNASGLDLNNEPVVYMSNSITTFTNIGTARLRHLGYDDPHWKAYMYDFSFTGSFSMEDLKAIHTAGFTGDGQQLLNITGGTASLQGVRQGMIFPVPRGSAVDEFVDVDYAAHRFFPNISFSSTGSASINVGDFVTIDSGQCMFANFVDHAFPSEDFVVLGLSGQQYTGTVNRDISNSTIVHISVTGATAFSAHVVSSLEMDTNSAGDRYTRRSKTRLSETISITGSTAQFVTDISMTSQQYIVLNGLVDVLSLDSITGQYLGATADVTAYFRLDNGQTDELYDHSKMYLISGITASDLTGPYEVSLTRYAHAGQIGPFTVDSYPTDEYDLIPSYTNKYTGRKYQLRDVIDFRPSRGLTSTMQGHNPPTSTLVNDNDFTYVHHLPRTDKIVATRNRTFEILKGVSDMNATVPFDDSEKMTLYTVTFNPYTFTKDDVSIRRVENKRYTMRDIGDIEKRVESVENFATLSILEQEAKRVSITDSNGLEIPKKGILVDQFRGHGIGDVEDPMYAASIDFNKGELRPSFSNTVFGFDEGAFILSDGATHTDDGIAMLSFTESVEITQPLGTTNIKINPSGVISYMGSLDLQPSVSYWFDDDTRPSVRVNAEGENDAWKMASSPFGTQWSDWQSNWFGYPSASETNTRIQNSSDNRSIFLSSSNGVNFGTIRTGSVPEQILRDVNDLKIKTDIVPYMKATLIKLSAKGLKPNTLMQVYFDGYLVNDRVFTIEGNPDVSELNIDPTNGLPISITFVNANQVDRTTDSNGNLENIYLAIPPGTYLTGRKSVRLVDSTNNATATTAADQVFSAQGEFLSSSEGVVSTRLASLRRESVRSEKIVTNILTRKIQRSEEVRLVGFSDPLSQTFTVDAQRYPSGMFISKVYLYLNVGGETNTNTPIMVQIKPTKNGYPHPSKIMPFGQTTKFVSDIQENQPTEFAFSTPVYLLPGQEYCVSVLTNSLAVSIDTAVMGEILTGETGTNQRRATKQPYIGKLFKAQSSGAYTSTEKECIRFYLHTCVFPTATNETIESEISPTTAVTTDAYFLRSCHLTPAETTVTASEFGSVYTGAFGEIPHNKNIVLSSSRSVTETTPRLTMRTINRFVSPIVDMSRSAVCLIRNIVNNRNSSVNGETLPNNETVSTANKAVARYITKRVVLEEGMEATNLKVIVSLCNPVKTNQSNTIEVYARLNSTNQDTPYDNLPYVKLTEENTITNSTDENDFNEVSFSFPTDRGEFKAFSVKIVMLSSDTTTVPRLKNMRIIAT